jgi:hypothetical protein
VSSTWVAQLPSRRLCRDARRRAREAGDAVRPIFERTVKELGLGPAEAEALMLRIAEAYVRGRTDGAEVFAQQVNRALCAQGIPIVVVIRHGSIHLSAGSEGKG